MFFFLWKVIRPVVSRTRQNVMHLHTCPEAEEKFRPHGFTGIVWKIFFFINDIVFKLFKFNLKKFKIGSLKKKFE